MSIFLSVAVWSTQVHRTCNFALSADMFWETFFIVEYKLCCQCTWYCSWVCRNITQKNCEKFVEIEPEDFCLRKWVHKIYSFEIIYFISFQDLVHIFTINYHTYILEIITGFTQTYTVRRWLCINHWDKTRYIYHLHCTLCD